MNNTERQPLIATRASVEIKARFAALATNRGCSESRLLSLMIERVLQDNCVADVVESKEEPGDRISLRLRPGDHVRVRHRAAGRGMKPASYLCALVHAHVRSDAPLPGAELNALKLAVAQLGRLMRTFEQLPDSASERPAELARALDATKLLVETVRRETTEVVRQNLKSWECADA